MINTNYGELIKQLDYEGCRNCVHQIEPLRMCEWGEKKENNTVFRLICPHWEKKENK